MMTRRLVFGRAASAQLVAKTMTPDELRERLFDLQDTAYREFHLKTCPDAGQVIGVRVPEQRKLAKEIIREDFWQFLDQIQPEYYEEILITGIVIASAPMALGERLGYAAWFIPQIKNWAICDGFCASFKPKTEDLPKLWNFILEYECSKREFELRFMLVMMLDHFLLPEYLPRIQAVLDRLTSKDYYVEMAAAWLVAEMIGRFRDVGMEYLSHDQLSIFAHNKAIQKACESRRVSLADKQTLRSMKL